jgi:hypothetical protein
MITRLNVALVGMLVLAGRLLAQNEEPVPVLAPPAPSATPVAPSSAPILTKDPPAPTAQPVPPTSAPVAPSNAAPPAPSSSLSTPAAETGLPPPTGMDEAGSRPGGPSLPILDDESDIGGEFWATGDYMVGWIRGGRLPPLATTSPPGTPAIAAGVLPSPTTAVVIGNDSVDAGVRSGGRFQVGYRVGGPSPALGFEAGFMFFQDLNDSFLANSDGSTILARPFNDAITGQSVATRIAFPGVSKGFIAVDAPSQAFTTVNADISKRFCTTDNLFIEGLAGYRFFSFGDDLQVTSQLTTLGGGGIRPGVNILAQDTFNARNTFHGGEMGFRLCYIRDRFSLDLLTKLAVGEMHQTISTFGTTITSVPGSAPTTSTGGLLALTPNINSVTFNNDWVLASELGINLAWRLTEHIRLRTGYTLIWWDGVARAGEQIDTVINQGFIPNGTPNTGPVRPAFLAARTDLFVNALNFGIEFRY